MAFQHNETEQQPDIMEDAQEPISHGLKTSPPEFSPSPDRVAVNHSQPSGADASTVIASKLTKLEEHLKTVGEMLNQHIDKEEIVTRSLIELESKINMIQKSLLDTGKTFVPSQPALDKSCIDQVNSANDAVCIDEADKSLQKYKIGSLTFGEKEKSTDKWRFSEDFAIPRVPVSEEKTGYVSETADELDEPLENSFLQNESAYPSNKERKNLYLIIVPFFILLAFFLLLVYYYTDMKKPADKKLIITEQINVSSESADDASSQQTPEAAVSSNPEEHMAADVPAPSPKTAPAPEVKDAVIPKKATPEITGASSLNFTVSVGSFKEKRNAIDLTTKLSQKGYPVHMQQLTQKKLFRVTVGAFPSRNEALAMASRLNKNEQLQTAIIDLNRP